MCETFIEGACTRMLFNRGRYGVRPWAIWGGALAVNIPAQWIPFTCGFLESTEMQYTRASHEWVFNDLFTNETKNGTTDFIDWTPLPRTKEEIDRFSKDGHHWSKLITFSRIGCTAIIGSILFVEIISPTCGVVPVLYPPVLYDGILESLKPLHVHEKLILVFSIFCAEGIEYKHDTRGWIPDYFNGTEPVLRAPTGEDFKHRTSYVTAVGYSFTALNLVCYFTPKDVMSYVCVVAMGMAVIGCMISILYYQADEYPYRMYAAQWYCASTGVASASAWTYITSYTTNEETWNLFICINEMSIAFFYFIISIADVGVNYNLVGFGLLSIGLLIIVLVVILEIKEACCPTEISRRGSMSFSETSDDFPNNDSK